MAKAQVASDREIKSGSMSNHSNREFPRLPLEFHRKLTDPQKEREHRGALLLNTL